MDNISEKLSQLQSNLDILWDRYLTALDEYTSCQQELSARFASGYFNLAQANARRTGGRRYGRDWYDERTKATARVKIELQDAEPLSPGSALIFSVHEAPIYLEVPSNEDSAAQSGLAEKPPHPANEHKQDSFEKETGKHTMLPTPLPSPSPDPGDTQAAEDDAVLAKKLQPDPAHWYGLFVAPSLRIAQGTFRSAILGGLRDTQADGETSDDASSSLLGSAVGSAKVLRQIETEIRATRKAIRNASKAVVTNVDTD